MTNFLVSYVFATVRLWLMVSGGHFLTYWRKGAPGEGEKTDMAKRLWLKMCSTPASLQGRAGLITSNGNVNQSHSTLGVSQILRGSSQFLCWWPGDMRADLLQKSNLIAQGKSAFPPFPFVLIISSELLLNWVIWVFSSYMGVADYPPPGVYH